MTPLFRIILQIAKTTLNSKFFYIYIYSYKFKVHYYLIDHIVFIHDPGY